MAGEIFISYRRADEAWARLLHSQLAAEGVEAWYDAQIGAGQDWRSATANALQASRIFVLLFSAAAAQSEDIAKELAAAIYSKKLVVPVRIENIEPTGAFLYELASRNWVNAFENTEAKLTELARSLARMVKSGKSDESVIPFDRNAGAKSAARPWRRTPILIATAVAAVAVAAAGLFWLRPGPTSAPAQNMVTRIAMVPFDVLSDDKNLNFFAAELADKIGDTLAKNQLQIISRSQVGALPIADRGTSLAQLGVTLYLGGAVQNDGQTMHVNVHLDDARAHVTLWSEEFSRSVKESASLQNEIAAATAFIVPVAASNHNSSGNDVQILSANVRANELVNTNDYQQARRVLQQLVTLAPNLASAHARLSLATLSVARQATADQAQPLLAEAKREAERALQLNPNLGTGYLALVYLRPSDDWQGRETLLLKGIAVDPNFPFLSYHFSKHLSAVGRLKDALPVDEQGLSLVSFNVGLHVQHAIELASLGRLREARESVERVVNLWPTNPQSRPLRLWFTTFFRPADEALALLDNPDLRPADLEPDTLAAWRNFIKTRGSHDASAKAKVGKDVAQLAESHQFGRADAVQILATLGDLDSAFTQMTKYIEEAGGYHIGMVVLPPSILFYPTTEAMRHDPRFIPFAAKLGLVTYWRTTGKWPDFCSQPLPYDCRAAAGALHP